MPTLLRRPHLYYTPYTLCCRGPLERNIRLDVCVGKGRTSVPFQPKFRPPLKRKVVSGPAAAIFFFSHIYKYFLTKGENKEEKIDIVAARLATFSATCCTGNKLFLRVALVRSEMISLKVGIPFAVSLNIGEKLTQWLCVIM